MLIRELDAADAAAFQALRLRGLLESASAFSSSHEEEKSTPLSAVAERLTPSASRCVAGAVAGAGLVGIAGLVREQRLKLAHKAFVWGMYVAPSHRRQGVGRRLLSHVLQRATAMDGVRQVNIGVNATNIAAVALYQELGFRAFGLERGCMLIDGVLHDEIQMVRLLGAARPAGEPAARIQ